MKEKHKTIKDLPELERPYEKCLKLGVEYLTDSELLAAIIRIGTKNKRSIDVAQNVLLNAKGESGLLGLYSFSVEELMKIDGIGKVKAVQLKCIAELAKRISKLERGKLVKFSDSRSVAWYYMEDFRMKKQEHLLLIMLDTKGNLIKEVMVSSGTVNYAIVDNREIFVTALSYEAVQIILLHNHPSGDATPSKQDLLATRRVKEAGELVGIELIDHIIIGDNQYISMREKKLI